MRPQVEFIRADITLTLALPKTGLLPERTGELFLADLGIPAAVYHEMKLEYTSPFGLIRRFEKKQYGPLVGARFASYATGVFDLAPDGEMEEDVTLFQQPRNFVDKRILPVLDG